LSKLGLHGNETPWQFQENRKVKNTTSNVKLLSVRTTIGLETDVNAPSRILICGGRDFADQSLFNHTMAQCKSFFAKEFCIINGFARGADRMAHVWAFFEGCPSLCVPANWDFYGKKAGPIRNNWMLKWCAPDLVIAFPGGHGTEDMIKQSLTHNIAVYRVQ
jgi:hypothetical protein